MKDIVKAKEVENKIVKIRNMDVILDSDIAELYGVETRDINKAVKNNPEKFPKNYLLSMRKKEKFELVENFHRFDRLKHSTTLPKAFTEKGLYMLATILKSPKATETTLSIIETFSKVREIARVVHQLPAMQENTPAHHALTQKTGELISDLIVPEGLDKQESEASIELNLAHPSQEPMRIKSFHGYPKFPTEKSTETDAAVNDTMKAVRQTLNDLSQFIKSKEFKDTITALKDMATSIDHLSTTLEHQLPNSLMYFNDSLKLLSRAASSVSTFTDYLSRHPEALLRGRQ